VLRLKEELARRREEVERRRRCRSNKRRRHCKLNRSRCGGRVGWRTRGARRKKEAQQIEEDTVQEVERRAFNRSPLR
jgi:hypothetical protein